MDVKNEILVVAPQIPAYDRASGDLRFFTIIKLLAEQYKVVFLALDQSSIEDLKYRKALEELGVTVYVKEFSLLTILKKHRCVAVFFEFYSSAEYYLKNIRIIQPNCPIIVDSVDIHYYREYLKYKLTGDSRDFDKSEATKKRELAVYRQADLVIAITEEDAEVVRKDAPDVTFSIIANIHEVIGRGSEARDKNKLVFIGGFKHQPNCDAIEYFCGEVFPLVLKKRPDMKLDIIGSGMPDGLAKYKSDNVRFLGFVPSVTPYLHKSAISVAPLRYGAGMKGKIGEAMAHGLPIVTTPIGVQGLDLKHKEHIMVAETAEDYASCIIELAEDENLYEQIAEKSLRFIEDNFTPEKIRGDLFEIFTKVLSRPAKKLSLSAKAKVLMGYLAQLPVVSLRKMGLLRNNV